MAGFLALSVSDTYIGDYRADENVENGAFVEFDHTEKTGKLAGEGAAEVYFVVNEIETIIEDGIDDIDFEVKKGKYLRAHRPQVGEILVTTVVDGDLSVGDSADVVADGKVGAADGGRFVVKEVTNEYGVETLHLLVVNNAVAADNTGGEED